MEIKTCPICDKEFTLWYHFERHLLVGHDERLSVVQKIIKDMIEENRKKRRIIRE